MKSELRYADQGPVLKAYRECRKFVQVIMGPLGSAKTTTSIQKLIELICGQKANTRKERRSRWAVVRNSYPDLTNTTIRDWMSIVGPLRLGVMTMGHPPQMKMDFDLPDGTHVQSEVIFLALDKDADVRKLRGLQCTGIWFNEMKEIPKSIVDMAQARVDRYPAMGTSTWTGIFGDTNAWDSDHWLEVIAEGKRQGMYEDYEIFYQPGAVKKVDGVWTVNPDRENKLNAHDKYYQRQIEGKREDWIKVNLANEIGYYVDGRPVHPEFSDSMHTAREMLVPTDGLLCVVGIDWGLTPAAAFLQRQRNGQWWVFDEVVIEDGDAIVLADEIKAKVAKWSSQVKNLSWTYRGDKSGDKRAESDSTSAFNIARANGLPVLPSSTNDPGMRRAALDRPLTRTTQGRPGIIFSPNCHVLRKGLAGGFNYKRIAVVGKEETYRDEPNKNKYSHICEAAEYALLDSGEHAVINSGPGGSIARGQPAVTVRPQWDPLNV